MNMQNMTLFSRWRENNKAKLSPQAKNDSKFGAYRGLDCLATTRAFLCILCMHGFDPGVKY